MFGPDVVRIPETENYVVTVGSGDREKPLTDYSSTWGVKNYFYAIVDQPLTANWFDDDKLAAADPLLPACTDESAGESCCSNAGMVCMDGLTTFSATVRDGDIVIDGVNGLNPLKPLSPWGWKFELSDHEQVVSGSLTVANEINFSTHIPEEYAEDACEGDLGDATTYNLDYLRAEGVGNEIIGGGLVPTPVAGKVILDGYDDPIPFCIGCGGENSPIGGTEVTGFIDWKQPKNRVYWNIKE
jgi:type IV pilus assembly protein PilY1